MRKHRLATLALLLLVLLIAAVPVLASCKKAAPTPTPTPTKAAVVPTTAPTPTPAATTGGVKPKEYVIGRLLGLTGTAGFWGEGIRAASEMAAEEINAAGGVDGVPIRYIYYDTTWQARPGVEGFTKLVDVDNVKVIGIGGSAVIPAVKPLAEDKKIPLINDAAYLEDSDYQGNKYFVGIQATRGQMNKGVIEILNTLGVSKIAIEYGNTAQTSGMANGIKKLWTDAGKQVVAFESHELDQKDFRSLLVKLKGASPDVVVHIPYAWSEAALFYTQMKEMNWKPQMVSTTNMFGADILKQAGDAVEGTIITLGGFNMFDVSNTKFQQTEAKFKARTGRSLADYSDWAAIAYDGTYMIAQAIKQGGYTSEGINNALHNIKDFQGITGKMSMDPATGLAQKTLGKAWVKNGQWTLWSGEKPSGGIVGPKPKEYVISSQNPLTGPAGHWGELMNWGAQLATEEINAAGGINGVPLRIIYEDNKAEPRPGLEAATKAIDVDKVKIILVSGSPVIPAVRPVTEDKHIILFNEAARLFQSEYQGNKYFFSNVMSREQESQATVDLPHKLGYDTAIIDFGNNAWGQGVSKLVNDYWKAKGHKVLAMESHELDQKDFRTVLVKYKALNPDVYFLLVYSWQEAALILNQAAEVGFKPKLYIGPDMIIAPETLQQAKTNSEGVVAVSAAWNPFDTTNQKMLDFVAKYTKKYGTDPLGWGATNYDAVYIVAEAIRQAGTDDPDKVAAALRNLKDFKGVCGNISMLPDGRPSKDVAYVIVKNGQFASYTPPK